MRRTIQTTGNWLFLLIALLAGGPAAAADLNVALEARAVDRTMPDGATVRMWGLAGPGGTPFAPVPVIAAVRGDNLTITLNNFLPEETSLVINGQRAAMNPQFFTDSGGQQRVRSFTHETAPGESASYTWSGLQPGTYLIQSGTHPGLQVPMGMYAVLRVDEGEGSAYPGAAYQKEAILLLSEVDPELHGAVAAGTFGPAGTVTSPMGYEARYFLVNGRPWSPGESPLPAFLPYDPAAPGVPGAQAAVAPGETVLLRFLNAGLRSRVPLVQGGTPAILAEDGHPYADPRPQHAIDLPAGKTADALLTAPAGETHLAVYDRMLGLAGGGMRAYLPVDDPAVPPAGVTAAVAGDGSGAVAAASLPGGIACGTDCAETYLAGAELRLTAVAAADSALTGWSVIRTADSSPTGECGDLGDCVITLAGDKQVTASFTRFTAVTLLRPNGGEVIPMDSAYPIRWGAPAAATTFDLGYSLGPGFPFQSIARRVTGREYHWTIPAAVREKGSVRVAVIGYGADGALIGRDASDATFALSNTLTLTAPNGGETLDAGDIFPITWTSRLVSTAVAHVGLWYQTAPGSSWLPLASLTGNPGSYDWTVPAVTTLQARVGIVFYDAAGRAIISDSSDAPFTIRPPTAPAALNAAPAAEAHSGGDRGRSIDLWLGEAAGNAPSPAEAAELEKGEGVQLLAPDGGEIVPAGSLFSILWQAPETAVRFAFEYSADGGKSWEKIAGEGFGSQFDWSVPAAAGGSEAALVRITAFDAAGETVGSDLSDAFFILIEKSAP